jgi:hypothetical protein
MLNGQRFQVFRRAVATLCVGLALMLSGQAYISLMDQIDHAHNKAHFANPLAGDVLFSLEKADPAGLHHPHSHDGPASHSHSHSHEVVGQHHSHAPADHQHGDAAIVFLAAQSFVLVGCPLVVAPCESQPQDFVSFNPRGPDHPPKSFL